MSTLFDPGDYEPKRDPRTVLERAVGLLAELAEGTRRGHVPDDHPHSDLCRACTDYMGRSVVAFPCYFAELAQAVQRDLAGATPVRPVTPQEAS